MENKIENILLSLLFIFSSIGAFYLMAELVTFTWQPIDLNNGLRGCYEAPGHNETYHVAVFITRFLFSILFIMVTAITFSVKKYRKDIIVGMDYVVIAIGGIILGAVYYALTGIFMLFLYVVTLIFSI